MTIIAIGIALFFAMNIGASGAAATLGIAYGTGAIRKKRYALLLCGFGIFLGAAFGSKAVITTIGSGIIASDLLTNQIVIIILASACLTLFMANMLGIPLSTSEVTVGSVIGVGIAYKGVFLDQVIHIVSWWLLAPFIACLAVLICKRIIGQFRWKQSDRPIIQKILAYFIIAAGLLEAVAAGMNNVANAVGPLVGGGILQLNEAMFAGALCIALGAYLLGGRVIETNGKRITTLSLSDGVIVSMAGASIAITASLFGIPIPMTQITTAGIIGVSMANSGLHTFQSQMIKRIIFVWVASPILSLTMAYSLIFILLKQPHNQFVHIGIICTLFIVLGLYYVLLGKRKTKQRSVVK